LRQRSSTTWYDPMDLFTIYREMAWTARPVEPELRDKAARIASMAMSGAVDEHVGQLLEGFAQGRYKDEYLIGLFDDEDRLRGAAFWQPLPGRVAVVWMPQLLREWYHVQSDPASKVLPTEDDAIYGPAIGTLFSEVERRIEPYRVRVSQILLETNQPQMIDHAIKNNDYEHLADLSYLIAERPIFPREDPAVELQYIPLPQTDPEKFAELVERTYIGTLDCPLLDGVREMGDVFESYRFGSDYDPDIWFRIQQAGEDVGVLILTEYRSAGQMELIYMGVVPERRGEGFGVLIAKYAQWIARQRSFGQLITAVDRANEPAIKMYAICGYKQWEERAAYIHVFPDD